MSEGQLSREISNQTATFAKIPPPQLNSSLSSIPEDPQELHQLESSIAMPQPLIKTHPTQPNEHEFTNKNTPEEQPTSKEEKNAPNITFYPRFADRLLYEQTDLEDLRVQQDKLKGELSGLNQMISDLIDKKNGLLNEYEHVIRDKRAYKRLKKNLEDEYEGYLFMLDGDYCQRLDEESEKQRQVVLQLKHQVHALNNDLSKPLRSSIDKEAQRIEQLEKQFYELQISQEKIITSNKRKMERLSTILQKNTEKGNQIKQINKKIDKCEYEREFQDDDDPVENKKNCQYYEELNKKLGKLKKIKEKNEKVKELECNRKLKEVRDKQANNIVLDAKIDKFNQKLYKVLVELDGISQQHSKASTLKEGPPKPVLKLDPLPPKRSSSAFKQLNRHFLSEKNKLTLQHQANTPQPHSHNQKSSKSLARIQTEPIVQAFDDRQELLMRNKKIYTQLQRNMYFKNIENRQEEKLSRIQEFDNKGNIAISSYDRFQYKNNLKLPQIDQRIATEGNDSIIYTYESVPQRKFNKKSIELHNRQMKQLRASKYHPNSSNYRQLCSILNRDRLLIEEDCQYDMSQLIYNSQT